MYFMALMEGLPAKAVGEALKRLHVPGRIRQKMIASHGATRAVARRLSGKIAPRPADIKRALHGLSDETILLVMAASKTETITSRLSAYLDSDRYVKPSLSGKDLKEMGLKPGPQFKKILDRLLDARLNGEVTSAEEERALVQRVAER